MRAVTHISSHGSNHTDAILTTDGGNAKEFLEHVQSSRKVLTFSPYLDPFGRIVDLVRRTGEVIWEIPVEGIGTSEIVVKECGRTL